MTGQVAVALTRPERFTPSENTDEIARAVKFLRSHEATSDTGLDLDVTGEQLA